MQQLFFVLSESTEACVFQHYDIYLYSMVSPSVQNVYKCAHPPNVPNASGHAWSITLSPTVASTCCSAVNKELLHRTIFLPCLSWKEQSLCSSLAV